MVVHSLVRRGVELASDQLSKEPIQQPEIHVSPWLLALSALTMLAMMVSMWSVCISAIVV